MIRFTSPRAALATITAVLGIASMTPVAQPCAAAELARQSAEIKTVYILPMSHNDIGFTDTPREVAAGAARRVSQALEFIRKDPDYVWNAEVFWELDQWLDPQHQPGLAALPAGSPPPTTQPAPDAAAMKELLGLVKQGRFGIGAAYASPHSSMMSAWTLDQLFRVPTQWAKKQGLTLDWAVINDVPGHPQDLPRFLAVNNVKYLLLGVNQGLSKPLPAEVCNNPFWWEEPDGSRVLTWISKGAYTDAFIEYGVDPGTARFFNPKEFTQTKPLEVMRHGLERLQKGYRERGYPYDAVLVTHAFDNWDAGAAARLPDAVRLWNASGGTPRLALAAPDRFFKHIEATYGPQLPVRRGGFGGQWELIRTTHPTAIARARAREAVLAGPQGKPTSDDIRQLLVFWEHTYGLGTPWPGHLTREQAIAHNVQEWELVTSWPSPELPKSAGKPTKLPEADAVTDGALRSNGLCLAGFTFINWNDFNPLPAEVRVESTAERVGNMTRCRQRIDRRTLPDPAHVIWAWKLTPQEATAPVVIKTANGTARWPEDGLGGYAQYHWVAPFGFQIGKTSFTPNGPFAFARPPEHPGWLLAYVLSNGRTATFKGGAKGQLTFEEVYQGESPIYEFTIDIGPVTTLPR